MRSIIAIALSSALSAASPALAAPAGEAPAEQRPAVKPAKPEKICRDLGSRTGTRMKSGRRCKTAEEWAKIDGNGVNSNTEVTKLDTISRTNR